MAEKNTAKKRVINLTDDEVRAIFEKDRKEPIPVRPISTDPNRISQNSFKEDIGSALSAVLETSVSIFRPEYNPEKITPFVAQDNNIRATDFKTPDKDIDLSSLNVMQNPGVTDDFFNELDVDLSSLQVEDTGIPERRATRMSIPDIFKYKYNEFKEVGAVRGAVGYYEMIGKLPKEDAEAMVSKATLDFYQTNGIVQGYSYSTAAVKFIVGETASQVALYTDMLFGGIKTGKDFALSAGGATLLAGQAGPQAAMLEEIITVPAAMASLFSVGMAYGGLSGMYKIEAGGMYRDLIEMNVDPQTATLSAIAYGLGAVSIESIGLSFLPPVAAISNKVAKTLLSNVVRKTITSFGMGFAKGVGIEVTEEVLTEIVGGTTKYIAQSLTENPKNKLTPEKFKQDLYETFLQATAASIGFGIVGGGFKARQYTKKVNETIDTRITQELKKDQEVKNKIKESLGILEKKEEKIIEESVVQEVSQEKKIAGQFKAKETELSEAIEVLQSEVVVDKAEDKGTKVKENKIQKIKETKEFITELETTLSKDPLGRDVDFSRVLSKFKAENITDIGPADLRIARHKAVVQSVRQTTKSIRESEILLKGQVQNVQKYLRKVIFDSELELGVKERANIKAKIKNFNSLDILKKELPNLLADVVTISEKFQTKILKTDIEKTLKKASLLKKGKFPKAKFPFQQQKVFTAFSDNIKKTSSQLNDDLVDLESKALKGELEGVYTLSDEQRLNLSVLRDVHRIKEGDLQRVTEISQGLRDLLEKGRSEKILKEEIQTEQINTAKELLLNTAEKTKGQIEKIQSVIQEDKEITRVKETRKALKRTLHSMMSIFSTWPTLLEQMNINRDSEFMKEFDVFNVEATYKKNVNAMTDKFDSIINELTTKRKKEGRVDESFLVDEYLNKNFSKKEEIGSYYDTSNTFQALKLNRAQARYLFTLLQDNSLHKDIRNLGYTLVKDETKLSGMSTERLVNEFLSEQDLVIVEATRQFYDWYYDNVLNPAYRKKWGTDLPYREMYIPTKRKTSVSTKEVDMFSNPFTEHRISILPSQIQSRIATGFGELQIVSDLDVLLNYISSSEHFVAWDSKVQKFNRVFRDPVVIELLTENFGKGFVNNLETHVRAFTAGSARVYNEFYNSNFKKLINNFGVVQLAAKPVLFAKQLLSIPAYVPYVGVDSFIDGITDFAKNPVRAVKILANTDFMVHRKTNISRDLVIAAKLKKKFSTKGMSFTDMMLLSTTLGDRAAIYVGGWAVYRDAIKKGKTHEQAVEVFSRASSNTQQSSDLSQLSAWQLSSNPLMIMSSQFAQAPNQYFNKYMRSFLRVTRFRTKKDLEGFIANSFIFSLVLPLIYQIISYGGKLSKGDLATTVLSGSYNGMFFFGNLLQWGIRAIVKAKLDEERVGFRVPIAPVIDFFTRAVEQVMSGLGVEIIQGDFEASALLSSLLDLAEVGGAIKGIPVGRVRELVGSETPEETALKFFGYTEWAVNRILDTDSDSAYAGLDVSV